MDKDMEGLMPPPYDAPVPVPATTATSYPRQGAQRRRRLVNGLGLSRVCVMSAKTALSCVLTGCAVWLCIAVGRIAQRQRQGSYETSSPTRLMGYFDEAVAQCAQLNALPPRTEAQSRRENPRWNAANGQTGRVVLRNATLFDGEAWLEGPVDITLDKGLVVSVSASTASATSSSDGEQVVHDLQGRFVTPGLVDMHSHHLGNLWPSVGAITSDANEMNAATEALTPQARVLDALKPYDVATALIASGGVTSSLLLPGSANLIGGEGVPVKNAVRPGSAGEPVIEEMLLEHGVPEAERRRYIKMAMGENPKRVWKHTRMGSAMILRAHFEKAKALKERQDDYCEAVDGLVSSSSSSSRAAFIHAHGRFPYDAALESSVALLRGQVMAQNHNYETEDMETMLRISREFGFRVWGFHHAVEAWQVPDLLRDQGDNVTVATFAEFSLYKVESYEPSLHAGKILDEHGVAVAYKSDHSTGLTHAKYLASQAAVAHAFHLPEAKALQAVTSIPARAIDQDFRIGYCRSGYDADVVVWDAHPLSLGATPLQVFIDGARQLDDDKVQESMGTTFDAAPEEDASTAVVERDSYTVQTRYEPDDHVREVMCAQAEQPGQSFIIRGISKAFVHHYPELQAMAAASDIDTNAGRLELVIDAGRAVCLGSEDICAEHTQRVLAATTSMPAVELTLRDGHLLPGLTALTNGLGMREIATEASTGDGQAKSQKLDDPNTLQHAQHGVWLDGKTFARARLGGVTRAVSPPVADSPEFVTGVSAAILTSGRKGLTDGGIIKGDVALHLYLGDPTRASQDSVSNGIRDLRRVLGQSRASHFGTPLRKVVVGEMPVVVRCNNKYDLAQLILVKKDFPETKLVVLGGKEAPYVAKELAAADIPVILSEDRPAPDLFRDKDAVIGPPMSRSVASYLAEAGVKFALAVVAPDMPADFRIHELGPDAGWTRKYAGLTDDETVRLVTTNVEEILALPPTGDLVVFEGDPLRFGASVVLAFHGDGRGGVELATCFPREADYGPRLG